MDVFSQYREGAKLGQKYIEEIKAFVEGMPPEKGLSFLKLMDESISMAQAVVPATITGNYIPEQAIKKLQQYVKKSMAARTRWVNGA